MKNTTDVLVVGAGPVGLLLAAELSRDAVDILLIEQLPQRSFFVKALGVTARTLEIFEDIGIVDQAISNGVWIEGMSFFNDGVLAQTVDIPPHALPYGPLTLAQFETERLLEQALRSHGGCVHYGWKLEAFSQDQEGVSARIRSATGESRDIRCKWLVGCDGSHSTVRPGLGLKFEGDHYPQTFVLADVEVAWDLPRGRIYRFNISREGLPAATLVAVPVHGPTNRYRVTTAMPQAPASSREDAGTESTPDIASITAIMAPMLPPGTLLSSMSWSSLYRISHRIVPAYSAGRVFLAGDAAHIHPPIGGQGMNTGLQDAHNLAWKLTLAARGLASQELLASYSAERHPVGLDVVEQTSRAMNESLEHKIVVPGMRETQLLIGYRRSNIVQDERPGAADALLAAGDRAPDAERLRRPYVLHPLRLRDHIGRGRHVLIGYVADAKQLDSIAAMLDVLKDALGTAAEGFAIAAPESKLPRQERIALLTDASGEFKSAYNAEPGTVWLIRPDTHIAWCTATPSTASLQEFLARMVQPIGASRTATP